MITEDLQKLYQTYTGASAETITELPSSGSNRRYFRLKGDRTLIGVYGTSIEENDSFLYMADHFRKAGIPVPEVYCMSDDKFCYLQEDLGDVLLFNAIEKGRLTSVFSEEEKDMLRKTVRLLPVIQFVGADGFDFSRCYPQPEFNQRSILWDLNYFKYCFLKATGMEFQEDRLEDDFQKMSDVLLRSSSATFMYRDFQSRNVMLREGEPWLIDFQGGRKGPFYYDVASFLWQAKARYPESLRRELLEEYLEALRKYKPIDEAYFYSQLRHFVLFRTLQVLGAYGFRGYFEKKPHFIQSVPYAIENLRELLKEEYPEYPYLCWVLRELTRLKQFTDDLKKRQLTVRVMSFAYKKGIPNDPTGNGGGFVFDCRAVNNPGKYERYKPFTGLDEPVIRFLEEDGEIVGFLEHACALVDASVKRYMERGFTHLSVCFGCTGGQHRSVYSAQHLAEHLNRKFGVKVELMHREQNIEQTFEAAV
ncbi:RapZ C-terminal domain-containing protein [Bacteroides pyogenes]|uniref:RapZ C-terminal domain-containing protein n=1 Tax=Bacteroides pyogenes TaxID=310300 RepID=UPI0011E3E184|nr:RNase adapter RapZ [Bacteroides pyogenes]MBR8709462.1 RNase adapter protein RapZ [Bacteroides pyogenes]MBR8718309.1 RNase adapter protein RapZ [Bacteroides pyogenes]MBR8747813.1 RNase adapter protein RapZ [Bacteroides pyogenes]MBR8758120.1 RNase adapter protein RapZ [Bacteroides pyogenes]MBR8781347.1 RNase adapter protein RapZ [Bacteroides pyogenes]